MLLQLSYHPPSWEPFWKPGPSIATLDLAAEINKFMLMTLQVFMTSHLS